MWARSERTEALWAALLAAAAASLIVTLAPPGGDSASHLYRTELVREGIAVWDNLWFAGQYPLASYSLLYYLPAAVVGNLPLVVASAVVAAALFASLAVREWGAAAVWPARAFGVLAAGPLFTGTYSYAAGLAAALGALKLLQLGRPRTAVVAGAVALGFSPLAFAFLCVALAAVAIARGRLGRRGLLVGAGLAAAAALQLAALLAFPTSGRYPFSALSLAAVLTVSAFGVALARRSEQGRPLAAFFVLWALVSLAAFVVPSPFGDNLTRLRALVFPLVLLAACLAAFRPRWVAAAALAFALGYNLAPDVGALPKRAGDERTATAAFWEPALDFLRARASAGPNYRVEVVPTFGHWEAWFVPRAGFSLARGWYRQLDLVENPELYDQPLEPATYRSWLRRLGVRYVLLPAARLGPLGADLEAELLRSGRSGLRPAYHSRDWTIYRLPNATPILSGARIERLAHDRIDGRTPAPGRYRLRVRFNRYWRVAAGAVCLTRAPDGMTTIVAARAGRFTLTVDQSPATLLRRALGGGADCA